MRWSTALKFLRQSWPLILSGLAVTVYMKIDQVMLGAMLGDEAVGQYSVAVRISSVWYFIPSILATSLFPAILNARKQSAKLYEKRLQNYFNLSAGLAYLIAIPLSIAAPWVILLLFGEAYKAAGPVLAIHAWSCLFVFLGVARNQYLFAEKLFKFSMACTVAGAVVNILLNFLLIPSYREYGAAFSTLVSFAIVTLFSSFLMFNLYPNLRLQVKAIFLPIKILFLFKR
jgi:O-antigen/teichoic acid export membrane protein